MSRKIVPVPDISGLDVEKAKATLQKVDLKLRISKTRQFSNTIEKDRILLQSPAPGTKTKAKSAVKVVLSEGTRIFSTPNLIGLSIRRAQILLNTNGFNLGQVAMVYSSKEKDIVIAQEPPPGIKVMRDSRVNLLISLGPKPQEYVMPDLTGKSYSQALNFLKDSRFRIGNVRRKSYPGYGPGIVIQQYPQAGFKVNKNSIINLWISQG